MRVLRAKNTTSHKGIFYKEVIDSNKKVIDKVYIIRYRDESGREKQKTMGKQSQGIRLSLWLIYKTRNEEDKD